MKTTLAVATVLVAVVGPIHAARAEDCAICSAPLKEFLVNEYKIQVDEWDREAAKRLLCSSELTSRVENQRFSGTVATISGSGAFDLGAESARRSFFEKKKAMCDFRDTTVDVGSMEWVFVKDASAALDAFKFCILHCRVPPGAVTGAWQHVTAQTANLMLSYRPVTNPDPEWAHVVRVNAYNLSCPALESSAGSNERIHRALAKAVSCTWMPGPAICGQLAIETDQGSWIGTTARPLSFEAVVTEHLPGVPAGRRKVAGHESVALEYTTRRSTGRWVVYTLSFRAEPGYVLDPAQTRGRQPDEQNNNPRMIWCRGGTNRCSHPTWLRFGNPRVSEGGRSAQWDVQSRSEPAALRLEWGQSTVVPERPPMTRPGARLQIDETTRRVVFSLAPGASGGDVLVTWSDGRSSTMSLGSDDQAGRLAFESGPSVAGSRYSYRVVRPTCN